MKNISLSLFLALITAPLVGFGSPTSDRKIEEAAEASYNYRTVLEDNVKVRAEDGIVTLTGTVQDKDDRTLAADTVENLPGVIGVNNEIVVQSTYPEKSDGWMALKIRGRLLVKGSVSAASTTVNVKDGHVMLTGTADNLAQKELTGIYAAEIDGVKTVQNEIVVTDHPPRVETIDDASITSQVRHALLTHKSTSTLQAKVVTADGMVLITGEASSDAERSLVTKLARGVRGVNSVTNKMTVKG